MKKKVTRIQVFVGYRADGSRRYESFTNADKNIAKAEASAFRVKAKALLAQGIAVDDIPRDGEVIRRRDTVEHYLDEYLNTCRIIGLSPSTILEYGNTIKRSYSSIKAIPAQLLTVQNLQEYVNERATKVTAKTIRNELGILTAALANVRPDLSTRTLKLPKRQHHEMQIPNDEEMQTIITHAKGTPMYLPIILASMMGLRRSEILGLQWKDVDLNKKRIHIHQAAVLGEDGLEIKVPKTEAGNRTLPIPSSLIPVLKSERSLNIHVTTLTPCGIEDGWRKIREELNLPYRFHDLRHYHASAMIAVGAPDKYICADMGHSSMDMVRRVYGHVMEEKEREINEAMENRAKLFAM